MTSTTPGERPLLYLDDLSVGQRFGGGEHALDERGHHGLRGRVRPPAVPPGPRRGGRHPLRPARRERLAHGRRDDAPAGGAHPDRGRARRGRARRSSGRAPPCRGTSCTSTPRSSRCARRARGRTAAWCGIVTETSNQRGEVVQVVTATIVVPRRPGLTARRGNPAPARGRDIPAAAVAAVATARPGARPRMRRIPRPAPWLGLLVGLVLLTGVAVLVAHLAGRRRLQDPGLARCGPSPPRRPRRPRAAARRRALAQIALWRQPVYRGAGPVAAGGAVVRRRAGAHDDEVLGELNRLRRQRHLLRHRPPGERQRARAAGDRRPRQRGGRPHLGPPRPDHADGGGRPTAARSRTRDAIRAATGVDPGLYRPPYGAIDDRVVQRDRAARMVPVLWDADGDDWTGIRRAADQPPRARRGAPRGDHPAARRRRDARRDRRGAAGDRARPARPRAHSGSGRAVAGERPARAGRRARGDRRSRCRPGGSAGDDPGAERLDIPRL